jgi:hypothetical protein
LDALVAAKTQRGPVRLVYLLLIALFEIFSEPVVVAPVALNYPQYPVAQTAPYEHAQNHEMTLQMDGQSTQVHGHNEPNQAPAEA